MATLAIRGLDPVTHARSRVEAARHGRSMEAEVRAIFIDDHVPDAVAASEAGLHAIHHTDNAATIGEIERLLAKA